MAILLKTPAQKWTAKVVGTPLADTYKNIAQAIPAIHKALETTVPEAAAVKLGDDELLEGFNMRKGHQVFIPAETEVHFWFEWGVVGRKFNVDLAAIVQNRTGYVVDYLFHDKTQTFDTGVTLYRDDTLRSFTYVLAIRSW